MIYLFDGVVDVRPLSPSEAIELLSMNREEYPAAVAEGVAAVESGVDLWVWRDPFAIDIEGVRRYCFDVERWRAEVRYDAASEDC